MPRITKFPPFSKRVFRHARKLVGRCNFEHFWRAICAIASLHGRKSRQKGCWMPNQNCGGAEELAVRAKSNRSVIRSRKTVLRVLRGWVEVSSACDRMKPGGAPP